jgi:hypothetical protein
VYVNGDLHVNDPWRDFGASRKTLYDVQTFYGQGSWVETYFGL